MKNSMKPSLAEVQRELSSFVTGKLQEITCVVSPSSGASSAERLSVYSNAWYLRIEESLRDDYPRLNELCDEEMWHKIIRAYLEAYPSRSYTLAHAGDALPIFLSEWSLSFPWQKDLALIERALYQIRTAADPSDWQLQSLADCDPEKLQLTFQPGVQLIDSSWNVFELQQSQSDWPGQSRSLVVVYRDGFRSVVEFLTPKQFQFLTLVKRRSTLADILDAMEDSEWTQWLAEFAAKRILKPA